MCSEIVTLVVDLNRGGRYTVAANLEEIACDSVVVLAESKLPLGARVSIVCGFHELKGIVYGCEFEELTGCYTHILLDSDSLWDPQLFVPQHLLSLDEIRPTAMERPAA
jgi:hypothetical protein